MENKQYSQQKLEKNIPKYFLAMIFRNLWISMPVGIIYFQDRGLSYLQMGAIESIVAVIVILTDIPSGAFADIFGRKLSTGLGFSIWGFSLFMIAFSTEFWVYFIAGILLGLSDSLISGAERALFYDTLKELGRESQYIKYIGRRDLFTAFSIILSSILGGVTYSINISLPFYLHGIASLIAAIFIFSMIEPNESENQKSIAAQFQLITHSLSFTWKSKIVRFLLFFNILVLMIPMVFVNIMEQPYLKQSGVPIIYFGLIFAFTRGVIGFFGPLRYKIEQKLGEKGSLFLITGVFTVMFLLMAIFMQPFSIIFLFILFFTRDYTWTVLDKYTNDHIPSNKRATVLSIINFALNLVYSGLALLIGLGLDGLYIFGLSPMQSLLIAFTLYFSVIIIPWLLKSYSINDTESSKNQVKEEIKN
ncbi:MAG: MFS transporter [Candidatus Lokiarchaeota archaeon]|nr:MFS transporter [Candidatus Harpocratesius repetitus]